MKIELIAIASMIPIAAGPLPEDQASMIVNLCSGGVVSIPLDGDQDGSDRPCNANACHATRSRGSKLPDRKH